MRLANKVAIITGAGSGIGRATSILFAKEGANVVVADVKDNAGEETVRLIKADGGNAIFVHTDVTKAAEVEGLIRTTIKTWGKLDILYNNAGVPERPTPIEAINEAEWDRIYAVNTKGIFLGAKYAAPEMKKNGGGVIIITASISAVRVRPVHAAYCSSKGAAIVLTKALAIELAPYKIRVNCINPVSTRTPMWPLLQEEGADLKEVEKKHISGVPLGRLAEPEDIAYAALYLASDESSMVTGVALDVDGGRSIQRDTLLNMDWRADTTYLITGGTGFIAAYITRLLIQEGEENAKMQMCNLCLDKLAEDKKPICVAACRTRALDAGPMDKLKAKYGYVKEAVAFTYSAKVQ